MTDEPVTNEALKQAFQDQKEFIEYRFDEMKGQIGKICKNDKDQDRRIQSLEHRSDTQEKKCTEHLKQEVKESDDTAKWFIVGMGWALTIIALVLSVLT
ncbi:hypothetical protein [Sulfuricurvum sp.]|uniref:hypothetical protein n=1 Tax=Sulfuricurvum sp. TaxID=2025608 RepID=UPI00356595B8